MMRVVEMLRGLRDNRSGSMRLPYAIFTAGMAIVTLMTVQTASTKVAEKLNVITTALNKISF
jgi:Flp pilus assembly pilin Flp